MLIDDNKFKKIKVETQGGSQLGFLIGFELETDTGMIEKYYVKNKSVSGLFEDKLIINRSQVISLDDKKMIVEDGVARALAKEKKILSSVEKTNPVITSKEF